jgi:hypothetical protein
VGGGMAVQGAVAKLWLEKTGCPICEGYGLSETSPSASCNPVTATGVHRHHRRAAAQHLMKLLDDEGREVTTLGQPGEIAIKGPQVMAGYWQRPDETAKVMTEDGYFKSGDVGVMDERGYFKIVDRKKDMVLVSGFNVYPNEVEEVVADCPGVLECAVVGVPDDKTGEAVKLVIVKKDPALTEAQVREYCKANLTGYKQPKVIEFRTELPKTPWARSCGANCATRSKPPQCRAATKAALFFVFPMTTAILSALPEEQSGLVESLEQARRVMHAGRSFWTGALHGKPVVLALSGIGKVAAATTATVLIERFASQRIVFTGVAGGVGDGVQVGDVVVAHDYVQHDMDVSPLFERWLVPGYPGVRLVCDAELSAQLAQAVRHCLSTEGALLHAGPAGQFPGRIQVQVQHLFVQCTESAWRLSRCKCCA